jgi:hypothetical protein
MNRVCRRDALSLGDSAMQRKISSGHDGDRRDGARVFDESSARLAHR